MEEWEFPTLHYSNTPPRSVLGGRCCLARYCEIRRGGWSGGISQYSVTPLLRAVNDVSILPVQSPQPAHAIKVPVAADDWFCVWCQQSRVLRRLRSFKAFSTRS